MKPRRDQSKNRRKKTAISSYTRIASWNRCGRESKRKIKKRVIYARVTDDREGKLKPETL
jgi:hypothetical protein